MPEDQKKDEPMCIVHLEDDGPLREILKIALSTADPKLNIKQFISSDEALQFIQANLDTIALFVLDIRVPGDVDGIGVAEKIRALGSTRPIVVTSAFRKPKQDTLAHLNITWMPKPWHILDAAERLLPLARS